MSDIFLKKKHFEKEKPFAKKGEKCYINK